MNERSLLQKRLSELATEQSQQLEKLRIYEQFLCTFLARQTPLRNIAGHQCVPECFTLEYPGKPQYTCCSITGAVHHCEPAFCRRTVSPLTGSGSVCQTTGRPLEQRFVTGEVYEKERQEPRADFESVMTKRAARESAQKWAAEREVEWQMQKVRDAVVETKSIPVAEQDHHKLDAKQTETLTDLVLELATKDDSTAAEEIREAVEEAKQKAARINAAAAEEAATTPRSTTHKKRKLNSTPNLKFKSKKAKSALKNSTSADLQTRARLVLDPLVRKQPPPVEFHPILKYAYERCEYLWKIVTNVSGHREAKKLKFEYVCIIVALKHMRDGRPSGVFSCRPNPLVITHLPAFAEITSHRYNQKPFTSDQRTSHFRVVEEILKMLDSGAVPLPEFIRLERQRDENPTQSARALEHSTWLEFQPKPVPRLASAAVASPFHPSSRINSKQK